MFAKLYKARNIGALVLHYGAMAAIMAATVMLGPPLWAMGAGVLITAGTVGAAGGMLWLLRKTDFVGKYFVRHPDVHESSPKLGEMVKELGKKIGLKPGAYTIYDFRLQGEEKPAEEKAAADKEKKTEKLGLKARIKEVISVAKKAAAELKKAAGIAKKYLQELSRKKLLEDIEKVVKMILGQSLKTISKTHNAAAFPLKKSMVMITEPMLKLLNEDEAKAVLAHEFTHVAARHMQTRVPMIILSEISRSINSLALVAAAVTAGWGVVAFSVAASVTSVLLIDKIFSKKETVPKDGESSEKKPLTLEEINKNNKITGYEQLGVVAFTTALYSFFNPIYLGLFAATNGLMIASNILAGTFSRSAEYQADRGAVELGADPLALVTSLRKMSIVRDRSMEAAYNGNLPKTGKLSKIWKSLTATHPTVERRVKRLSDIARKQGVSEDLIKKAANDPIEIPKEHDLPYEVIRSLVAGGGR